MNEIEDYYFEINIIHNIYVYIDLKKITHISQTDSQTSTNINTA
jgi:hypothetical protein